jgi:hypothetical protein
LPRPETKAFREKARWQKKDEADNAPENGTRHRIGTIVRKPVLQIDAKTCELIRCFVVELCMTFIAARLEPTIIYPVARMSLPFDYYEYLL